MPLDEALTRVVVDCSIVVLILAVEFSGPSSVIWTGCSGNGFSFAQTAGLTLHVDNLYGDNNHHIVESACKPSPGRQAVTEPGKGIVPSTKGTLSDQD